MPVKSQQTSAATRCGGERGRHAMTGAGLPDLVAQAFEAASHPDGMTSFLAGTAEFFGAQQGAILVTPTHDLSAEIQSVAYGITPQHLQDWISTRNEPDYL